MGVLVSNTNGFNAVLGAEIVQKTERSWAVPLLHPCLTEDMLGGNSESSRT
jgi:hypothetical protein